MLVSWLGFRALIQATQVQFLGRELRCHFTQPLTAASRDQCHWEEPRSSPWPCMDGAWTELPSVSQEGAFPASWDLSPMDVAPPSPRISFHRTPDISTNGMLFSQTTCYCYLYEKCFSVFVFKLVSCSCIYSQTVGGLPRIPCSLQAASRKQREE